MPTNVYQGRLVFDNNDLINVLATELGMRSPLMATLDLNYVQPQPGTLARILKPGYLVSLLPSGLGRIFPASRVRTAFVAGATQLVVKDASIFRVGDTLRNALTGAANLGTVQSIDIATNTLTVTSPGSIAGAVGSIVNAVEAGAVTDILGMVLSPNDVSRNPNDVGLYTSASLYGRRLPFWHQDIYARFPEMIFMRPVPDAELP